MIIPVEVMKNYPPNECYIVEIGSNFSSLHLNNDEQMYYSRCQDSFNCLNEAFSVQMHCIIFMVINKGNISLLKNYLNKPLKGLILNLNNFTKFQDNYENNDILYPMVKWTNKHNIPFIKCPNGLAINDKIDNIDALCKFPFQGSTLIWAYLDYMEG